MRRTTFNGREIFRWCSGGCGKKLDPNGEDVELLNGAIFCVPCAARAEIEREEVSAAVGGEEDGS